MAVKTKAIDFKDALLTIMYTQEALIKLLGRKGIITEEALLGEIKKIKKKKDVPFVKSGSYSKWSPVRQSSGFLNRLSGVRIPPGAPFIRVFLKVNFRERARGGIRGGRDAK